MLNGIGPRGQAVRGGSPAQEDGGEEATDGCNSAKVKYDQGLADVVAPTLNRCGGWKTEQEQEREKADAGALDILYVTPYDLFIQTLHEPHARYGTYVHICLSIKGSGGGRAVCLRECVCVCFLMSFLTSPISAFVQPFK